MSATLRASCTRDITTSSYIDNRGYVDDGRCNHDCQWESRPADRRLTDPGRHRVGGAEVGAVGAVEAELAVGVAGHPVTAVQHPVARPRGAASSLPEQVFDQVTI